MVRRPRRGLIQEPNGQPRSECQRCHVARPEPARPPGNLGRRLPLALASSLERRSNPRLEGVRDGRARPCLTTQALAHRLAEANALDAMTTFREVLLYF